MAACTHVEGLINKMYEKDTSAAFRALQELEQISDETGLLYPYTDKFVDMISNEKYVMRVRGFRLFCKQAKWDTDYKLDENIDEALRILSDVKPTAVRQALAALKELITYKPDLRDAVNRSVKNINYMRYKDTMHSLIQKDIKELIDVINTVRCRNGN